MAATTGTFFLSTGISVVHRRTSSSATNRNNPSFSTRRFAAGEEAPTSTVINSIPLPTAINSIPLPTASKNTPSSDERKKVEEEEDKSTNIYASVDYLDPEERAKKSLKDYFDESRDLINNRSAAGGGGPRWFSPVECGAHSDNSPLLLYLPGIDGVGLGLIRQHHRLGKVFDVLCLHIPVKDRTPFKDLVKLVETTVRSENRRAPNRPIYLIGDSLGGCLALEVAARNSDIDLVLVLSNPATSFGKSQLQSLITLLELVPDQLQLQLHLPFVLSLFIGDPLKRVAEDFVKGLMSQQIVGLPKDLVEIPSYLSGAADILPKETLIWKLKLLRSASVCVNSHLHAVKAQTLILSSGKDQLLPSEDEGKRLQSFLPSCEIRHFGESGHFLFLEDDFDLLSAIKAASFFRRSKEYDCVKDFLPPTHSEFYKVYEANRLFINLMNPVMLSTLEDGKVVNGLTGIPTEGPVLYVGYHMLMGLELSPMVSRVLIEKNILMRGIAHPLMFERKNYGFLTDRSQFDKYKIMGAVPVSATNLFRLLSSKSHVLLYPGGMREAVHRKGEEYKLFWPERSEFVRMAARFGAKIVPFGVVGEDDLTEVVLDYHDLIKIPYFRDRIEHITEETVNVRSGEDGEVANQQMHMPWILPKLPGRFYYCFGKPIETAGRKELKNREKAHELYLEVKSEVEKQLAFLKEKREHDPYRSIVDRARYQATHGFTTDVPTFEL